MIISGGENVYSVEVEEVLALHPAVAEVAVFGVPDPHWGEAVHAVVRPRDGFSTDGLVELLQAHCRTAIAGYKIPKRIDMRAEPLPVSGPGKVLKRQLRDEYRPA
jgi:long-chain acyl-CoA synthetase